MKNLNVLAFKQTTFDRRIVGQCTDFDNKRIFALTEDLQILLSQHGAREIETIAIQDESCPDSLGLKSIAHEDVILMEYVVELGSILIVLRCGHFIQVGVSSFSPPSKCAFKHSRNICSVQLSPDQDLIALADVDNDISILNTDFSVIHSANALTQNESLHKPVGVGWGSKETQFFGLDGRPSKEKESQNKKILTDSEQELVQKIEAIPEFHQHRAKQSLGTVLDWRGDGQLIASLTFIPDTRKHYLKVWNRNLELQYMSEQLVTMESGLLSWIPNGQYVCCAQRRDQCVNEIAMFEKNGMVHQRITLPTVLSNLYIEKMAWAPDSKILAIIGRQFSLNQEVLEHRAILLLYTMQNFHYYLKHTSYLDQSSDYFLKWDPISPFKLHISTSDGECHEFLSNFRVDYCHDSAVVVIDADRILVTPYKICNIPPPMSAIEVRFETLINRVAIDLTTNEIYVLTIDNILTVLGSGEQELKQTPPSITINIRNKQIDDWASNIRRIRRFHVEDANSFTNITPAYNRIVATRQSDGHCEIHLLESRESSQELDCKVIRRLQGLQVVSILGKRTDNQSEVAFLLDDGSCLVLNLEKGKETRCPIKTNVDERFGVIDSAHVEVQGGQHLITLALDQTLRINDKVLVSGCCTSFRTNDNFIAFTTTENNLHFVPLSRAIKQSSGDLESWSQTIEMGGTLVVIQNSKVVLQMPRGNLETIHPRILILLSIIQQLDKSNHMDAMRQARRHRLDLNFLCDYMIRRDRDSFFSKTLREFCQDIINDDPALLSLLINELNNTDTLATRYEDTIKFLPLQSEILKPHTSAQSKVHLISQSIEEEINKMDNSNLLQPKLLCLLRQEPKKTEQALREIHNLNESDKNSALRFLLYFVSVEQLFLDALSTYDTDLALMVASVSTKDPKEYLALLDEFNEMKKEYLRKFKIDLHVKNFEKAFQHILLHALSIQDRDPTTHKIITFVESTRLYKFAVREIARRKRLMDEPPPEENGKFLSELECALWLKYADYLSEKRYDLEAGIAYSKVIRQGNRSKELILKAMSRFSYIHCWDRPILLHQVEEFSCTYKRSHFTQMFDQAKVAEGALVMNNIKSDLLAGVFADGYQWYLASCVAEHDNREAILEKIQDRVTNLAQAFSAELDEAKRQFDRLKTLLTSAQQTQRTKQLDADNCLLPDSLSTVDGSEISSVWSDSQKSGGKESRPGAPSLKTRVSTKSTKSQASRAKKISTKPGSRFEDLGIILELKKFIGSQKSNQEAARDILASCFDFSGILELDGAKELLEPTLNEAFELAREIADQLWPKEDKMEQKYSLYKRFSDMFSRQDALENIDFEVLIRPALTDTIELIEL